jgi:hypothetical protein
MAHAFTPIPAKPTFGTLRENLYQSDYLERKKAILAYCNTPGYCNKPLHTHSYDQKNLYNLGKSINTCNFLRVNKGNLVAGQYSQLDLNNVCTVIPTTKTPCNLINGCAPCATFTPVPINLLSTVPFYQTNNIDPLGQLFGNSQCGELNYTNFMIFYPPERS